MNTKKTALFTLLVVLTSTMPSYTAGSKFLNVCKNHYGKIMGAACTATGILVYQKNSPDSKTVQIYHFPSESITNQKDPLKSIRKHGLLTMNDLENKGLAKHKISQHLPDQYGVVYFRWFPEKPTWTNQYVALNVDPNNTNVYDQETRITGNQQKYNKSKMTLSRYIALQEERKYAQKQYPGKDIIAEPVTHLFLPKQPNDTGQEYIHEIIIPGSIPPEHLIFPEQDVDNSTPELNYIFYACQL